MLRGWSIQFVIGLFVLAMGVSFLIFSPQVRKISQELLFKGGREVLSSLEAKYGEKSYKIIKLRDIQGILVEIYEIDSTTQETIFVDSSHLTDKKDAFYEMDNKKLNLFLKDIDGDNIPEIITPSYDRNLIAHLNIFSFNPITRKLVKLSEH